MALRLNKCKYLNSNFRTLFPNLVDYFEPCRNIYYNFFKQLASRYDEGFALGIHCDQGRGASRPNQVLSSLPERGSLRPGRLHQLLCRRLSPRRSRVRWLAMCLQPI
jgi:hypothetical protein